MKKNIKVLFLLFSLLSLNACMKTIESGTNQVFNGLSSGLRTFIANGIKLDSSVILLVNNTKDTKKIQGRGKIFFKNIETNKEYSIDVLSQWKTYSTLKLVPGKYIITKWSFDSCSIKDKNNYCKKWHDFGGVTRALNKNTFTIKKSEVLYLGYAEINSKSIELSISDYGSEDIKEYREMYDTLKDRKIKNISSTIEIKNWKYKITGAGWFK